VGGLCGEGEMGFGSTFDLVPYMLFVAAGKGMHPFDDFCEKQIQGPSDRSAGDTVGLQYPPNPLGHPLE
jgi:hypothetical protein